VYAAPMASADQKIDIRTQEVPVHRDLCPVGEHEVGAVTKFFDEAEYVIPPAAVESGRVLA
jgi:hypothetical protein